MALQPRFNVRAKRVEQPAVPSSSLADENMLEDMLDHAALHPDRKKCGCGKGRSLKRRAWTSVSPTVDGPKWVFLWQCACGSHAFDHVEGLER